VGPKGGRWPLARELTRLDRLLTRGLAATAALWPAIELTYGWVHRAAHVLGNGEGHDVGTVRARYDALLTEVRAGRDHAGYLTPAIDHFLKVTASYHAGLFHCYTVPGLPPTDNDLEHVFGSARRHERRPTGRKVASPALVLRGAVRVVTAVATQRRQRSFEEGDLQLRGAAQLAHWRQVRGELEHRHEARRAQLRFRRQPDAYLAALEDRLLQSGLPA
jgi:hypothetical protein